jgi:hypothetical protein
MLAGTVIADKGESVTIEPTLQLKLLLVLNGRMP